MRTNYLILYTGGKPFDNDFDQEEVLKAWDDWYNQIGNALVDAGNPFSTHATSITSDGMVAHNSEDCMSTGYSIIQADSLEEAVAMASICPILKDGAKVSVYETFDALSL